MRPLARGLRAGCLLAVALLALVAGCGVPDDRPPEEVGKAPGFGGAVERPTANLPDPNNAPDAKTLVDRFLQAAANGDWDPALNPQRIEQAIRHASRFMTAQAAQGWKPGVKGIVVVEAGEPTSPEPGKVTVDVRSVGVLGADGAIEPPTTDLPNERFTFTVERSAADGGEYRLTGVVPPFLLLSTKGLQDLFDVRPVYFWDNRDQYLVPDRRYIARGVSRDKRIQLVIDRLIKGPSKFLVSSVNSLPVNTRRENNPVVERDKIVVDLSAAIPTDDQEKLSRLATQIRWSLHPEKLDLELLVAGRSEQVFKGDDYLSKNPSAANRDEVNDLYGVADHKVVQAKSQAPTPSVLDAPDNRDVVSAAVNRMRNWAALVRTAGPKQELWIGRFDRETAAPHWSRTSLSGVTLSRPSYLPGANRVLIAADGGVYDVDESGAKAITGPSAYGPVTSVSVSPDGSRLAFVAGGTAYVATLGAAAPLAPASLGEIRPLYALGRTGLHSVAWALEDQLVVASQQEVLEIAIDNGHQAVIATTANVYGAAITHLAAVPKTTAVDSRSLIVIQAGQLSFNVYPSRVDEIRITTPLPSPSGSVSPSAGTGTSNAGPPLWAPFYPDLG